MNVIGSRPDAWWRDRDAAMARLVADLERWAEASGEEEDVTVVFERPASPPLSSKTIAVAHAPRPGPDAADDEIVRRLGADPDPGSVTVVTSDRRLAARVKAIGAAVEPASGFRARLETA